MWQIYTKCLVLVLAIGSLLTNIFGIVSIFVTKNLWHADSINSVNLSYSEMNEGSETVGKEKGTINAVQRKMASH